MTEQLAQYTTLHSAMTRARVPVAVSELHGGMCGSLCAGGVSAVPAWVEACLGDSDQAQDAVNAVRVQLRALQLHSWRSLNGSGLEFYPLLPDDEAALEERVGALALWCHGFVSGLGLAGLSLNTDTAAEAAARRLAEIVGDFSEISRAAASAEDFADEDAADFALTELIEYVRVSVQIVFEELEPQRMTGVGPAIVH